MRNDLDRRQLLRRLALGSGALALAGSGSRAVAEDKFLTSAKLDNFDLYFEVHGEGTPVVFAHGAGGTHMSWWQQVPVFSKKYKCITIDHRTFGSSRDVQGGPGRGAFVKDLKGLLDQLPVRKVALIGQSMGGSTVLGYASANPDRVSALILSDTTGGYSNPEMAEIRKKLAPRPASVETAFAPDFAKREPAREFLYREISALTTGSNTALPTSTVSLPSPDLRPVLDKKIPVLFVVGEQDQIIPPPIIEAMHRKMPGSQLIRVPGAGHSVYFEKPDEYNKIVMEFLQKHALG